MAFKDIRRQKFLNEKNYLEYQEELIRGDKLWRHDLAFEERTPGVKDDLRWRIAFEAFELLVLRYTAGRPVAELRAQWPKIIDDFDEAVIHETRPRLQDPSRNVADTLEITQHEAYVHVLWLLALCKLLGHETLAFKVIAWLDKNAEFSRGRDTILEQIINKITGRAQDPGRYLLHVAAYKPLGLAILAVDAAERPVLMKEFVEGWYKNMKPCYWYGTHTEGSSYFGYWAFEAALVTVLWEIDDSSYRDHLVYPKDLADWARGKREDAPHLSSSTLPPSEVAAAPPAVTRLAAYAGDPCPQAGDWQAPRLNNRIEHVERGQPMPGPERTATGAVVWYLVAQK